LHLAPVHRTRFEWQITINRGQSIMTFKRSFTPDSPGNERRSGLNRRWIKAPYDGVERRAGQDRRGEPSVEQAVAPSATDPEQPESLEALLFSTTVRLEALARLLIEKGVLSHEELADALQAMQREFHRPRLKND
jgi:hypothetical protein